MNTLEIAHTIVAALEDKKGEDILLLDLQKAAAFTDYFVIASANNDRLLDALADAALDNVREKHKVKGRAEGRSSAGWLVVDFGPIVVHLFAHEQRAFYNLEELWSEGKTLLRLK